MTSNLAVASPHELVTVCGPGVAFFGTVNMAENELRSGTWAGTSSSPSHNSSTESHLWKPLPRAVTLLPGGPLDGFNVRFAASWERSFAASARPCAGKTKTKLTTLSVTHQRTNVKRPCGIMASAPCHNQSLQISRQLPRGPATSSGNRTGTTATARLVIASRSTTSKDPGQTAIVTATNPVSTNIMAACAPHSHPAEPTSAAPPTGAAACSSCAALILVTVWKY